MLVFFVLLWLGTTEREKYIDPNRDFGKAYKESMDFLAGKLVMEKELPSGADRQSITNLTFLYVLGGNQVSLIPRFRRAADLYHQGYAGEIHILSRPGITEFSPELKRNLTNDEWAIRELEKLDVKRKDIIPVPVDHFYFGTFDEAKGLSAILRKQGYKRLILVSSIHHTRRAYETFRRVLEDSPVDLYVYGANGNPGMQGLLVEFGKLLFYEDILIPVHQWLAILLDRYSHWRGRDFGFGLS
jgi:uncharacterized SAM-binding protein YcdF (DUF218 family)